MNWAAQRANSEVGRRAFQFFLDQGMAPHQAAAIAGNMAWESGGRSTLVNPNDNLKNSPRAPHSIGIGQWNDRSPALLSFARERGVEFPDGDLRDPAHARAVIERIPLGTQLEFAAHEMSGPEARAGRGVRAASDLHSASASAIGYHRPAGWTRSNPTGGHGFSQRMQIGQALLSGGAPANGFNPSELDPEGVAGLSGRSLVPSTSSPMPPRQPLPAAIRPSVAPQPNVGAVSAASPAPVQQPWATSVEIASAPSAKANGFDRKKIDEGLDAASNLFAAQQPKAPDLRMAATALQWRPV